MLDLQGQPTALAPTGAEAVEGPSLEQTIHRCLSLVGLGCQADRVTLLGRSGLSTATDSWQTWYRPERAADPSDDQTMLSASVWARLDQGDVVNLFDDDLSLCSSAAGNMLRQPTILVLPVRGEGRAHHALLIQFDQIAPPPGHPGLEQAGAVATLLATALQVGSGNRSPLDEHRSGCRGWMLEQLNTPVICVDGTGRLSYLNQAGLDYMGTALDQATGGDLFSCVHPEDRVLAGEHMTETLLGHGPSSPAIRFRIADGSYRWFEVDGRALRDDQGNPDGFLGVLVDIHRRQVAELDATIALKRAKQARDSAERASQAKSEFLSRMSHELRTPLNAILGFAQLLELDDPAGETGDNIRQILRAGRHLLVLVNDAIDMERIETGRLSLSLESVQIRSVVLESVDLIRSEARKRQLIFSPDPEQLARNCQVHADRHRLKQVLVNLLSNAVKYNRTGGAISVECRRPPRTALSDTARQAPHGYMRISVSDTGLGIAPNQLDDAFVPFNRLGAEASKIEGIGLGLSVSKSLVEKMGGTIGISSVLGVGTTVYLDLPAAAAPAEQDADLDEKNSAPAAATTVEHTVLYIEDNPANVMLARRVLHRLPEVRLEVAGDGQRGLEMIRANPPDVLLLDLHLPVKSGQEVLAELRTDPNPVVRAVPVVVVTADLTPGTEQRLIKAGANAFLSKPVDVRLMYETIEDLLPRD